MQVLKAYLVSVCKEGHLDKRAIPFFEFEGYVIPMITTLQTDSEIANCLIFALPRNSFPTYTNFNIARAVAEAKICEKMMTSCRYGQENVFAHIAIYEVDTEEEKLRDSLVDIDLH